MIRNRAVILGFAYRDRIYRTTDGFSRGSTLYNRHYDIGFRIIIKHLN